MRKRHTVPLYVLGTVALALACTKDPPPRLPDVPPARTDVTTTGTSAATKTACLPKGTKGGSLLHLEADGGKALICYGEGGDDESTTEGPCLEVDLATGAPRGASSWQKPTLDQESKPGPWTLTTTNDSFTVCKTNAQPKQCSTVKVQHKPIAAGHGDDESSAVVAEVNDDGSRVFVFAPERKGPKQELTVFGDTYDVKTGKRIFHQKLSRDSADGPTAFYDSSNHWSASFEGKNLLLGDYVCCGPGGSSFFFDPEKGTLKHLHDYQGYAFRVDGPLWITSDEKTLRFFNAETLQDVGGPIRAPGEPIGEPMKRATAAVSSGGKLVFAYANPPGYMLVDVATKSVTQTVKLPVCP